MGKYGSFPLQENR